MNLATMRVQFNEHTADLANALTDAEVDVYLNRAYRYVIPADVGGELSETLWELQTATGIESYDYATHIIAPKADAAWIESYTENGELTQNAFPIRFLDVETDRSVWTWSDRLSNGGNAVPSSALFWGRKVYLSPKPDRDYIVKIPARGGPSSDLGTSGLTNEVHAKAVVHAATADFLALVEDASGVQRESALYQRYRELLYSYAQSRPNHRRVKRSF